MCSYTVVDQRIMVDFGRYGQMEDPLPWMTWASNGRGLRSTTPSISASKLPKSKAMLHRAICGFHICMVSIELIEFQVRSFKFETIFYFNFIPLRLSKTVS